MSKKLFDIAADSSHIQLIILSALSLHHLQKFWKIDRSVSIEVDLHDQLQHLVLRGVLALHIVHVNPASRPPHGPHHGPHDSQQLLGGDGAAAVLGGD